MRSRSGPGWRPSRRCPAPPAVPRYRPSPRSPSIHDKGGPLPRAPAGFSLDISRFLLSREPLPRLFRSAWPPPDPRHAFCHPCSNAVSYRGLGRGGPAEVRSRARPGAPNRWPLSPPPQRPLSSPLPVRAPAVPQGLASGAWVGCALLAEACRFHPAGPTSGAGSWGGDRGERAVADTGTPGGPRVPSSWGGRDSGPASPLPARGLSGQDPQ